MAGSQKVISPGISLFINIIVSFKTCKTLWQAARKLSPLAYPYLSILLYLLRPTRLCGRQPESYLPWHILISGMIFVSYLSDFSLVFSSGEKLSKVAGHNESDQVKNRPFERGCRWIKLIIPPLPEGGGGYTVLPLSVQDIFRRIFLSNC